LFEKRKTIKKRPIKPSTNQNHPANGTAINLDKNIKSPTINTEPTENKNVTN
jgi:hypothetical protein